MTVDRDSMVFTPRLSSEGAGPRRRAQEARAIEGAKRRRSRLMQKLKRARQVQTVKATKAAETSAKARTAAKAGSTAARKMGVKAGSRLLGPIGMALLAMDAVNLSGETTRRGEEGFSGRLLAAMDQDKIYGDLDERATGAAGARSAIESREDLLFIIGTQGRVNAQIAELGAYYKEKATARAIGADLIEREPGLDHLGTVADKAIVNTTSAVKAKTDSGINAIRSFLGKGPITR